MMYSVVEQPLYVIIGPVSVTRRVCNGIHAYFIIIIYQPQNCAKFSAYDVFRHKNSKHD